MVIFTSKLKLITTILFQEEFAGVFHIITQLSDYKFIKTQWITRFMASNLLKTSRIQFRSPLVNTQLEILSILLFSTIGWCLTGDSILSMTTRCMFTPSRTLKSRILRGKLICGIWMASIQATLNHLTTELTPPITLLNLYQDPSLMLGTHQTTFCSSSISFGKIHCYGFIH